MDSVDMSEQECNGFNNCTYRSIISIQVVRKHIKVNFVQLIQIMNLLCTQLWHVIDPSLYSWFISFPWGLVSNSVQKSKLLCEVQLHSNVCYILIKVLQFANDIKIYITVSALRKVWPKMEYFPTKIVKMLKPARYLIWLFILQPETGCKLQSLSFAMSRTERNIFEGYSII